MAVIGGIVGAKLYYVLLNWRQTAVDPLGMIFSRGGMVWYGGFIGATALVVWDIRRSKLPLGRMADVIAAPLALSYAVGRIGCFMVGDDYGRPTALPWGIAFPNGTPPTRVAVIEREFGDPGRPCAESNQFGNVVPVHPTQLYEVALSTLIFFVLWRLGGHRHSAGWLFMLWLVLAGAERFVVEIFRAKDDRFFGPLTDRSGESAWLWLPWVCGDWRVCGPVRRRDSAGKPRAPPGPRAARRRARA